MTELSPKILDKQRQTLEVLDKLHAKTMSKLLVLHKRQLELYKKVSARLDLLTASKAAEDISSENKNKQ